jgi:DHA1 family bicyclomycin/chloramphenicol resistance-like MFS transporter
MYASQKNISKKNLLFILGILAALGPLSIDMYLPAFTLLEKVFHTDARHVQLTLSSFFVALAFGQLAYGPLSDYYGRKPILYVGLGIYIVASALCIFAASIEQLIALRFFQALGASAGMVVGRAIVSDLYNAHEAAGVYSTIMLVMGVAPMLAPIAGGHLVAFYEWNIIFGILAVFGVLALLLIYKNLVETTKPDLKLQLTFSSVFLRYGGLFKNRRFLGYTLSGGLTMSSMFAYIASSPFVFIEHFKITTDHFGWVFGINALGFILFAQINTQLLKIASPLKIITITIITQVIFALLMVIQSWMSGELYAVAIPLFLTIALTGILMPNMTALGMAHFSTHAGEASAFMGSIQFLIAGLVSMGTGALHSSSPLIMTFVMFLCVFASFLAFYFFCKKAKGVE